MSFQIAKEMDIMFFESAYVALPKCTTNFAIKDSMTNYLRNAYQLIASTTFTNSKSFVFFNGNSNQVTSRFSSLRCAKKLQLHYICFLSAVLNLYQTSLSQRSPEHLWSIAIKSDKPPYLLPMKM